MKISLKFFLFILPLIWLIPFNRIFGQNLALHKPYTLSVVPNYKFTTSSGDSALTDGIYTKGRLWPQKTTAGWQRVTQIKINIDLGQEQSIGTVKFNTAGGTADVYLPQNIYVFTSVDGIKYSYVGDAVAAQGKEYGAYQKINFSLKDINQRGRYVALVAVPSGKYLFCDEIEVLKGHEVRRNKTIGFALNRLEKVVDSLKLEEFNKGHLKRLAAQLTNISNTEVEINYKDLVNKQEKTTISKNKMESIRDFIGESFASYLGKMFKTYYIVTKYNPWDSVPQLYKPKQSLDTLKYQFSVPVNGVQYGSFLITNSSNVSQSFQLRTNYSELGHESIEFFETFFVPGEDSGTVADPIIPIDSIITVESGFSKLVFFKLTGLKEGKVNASITIRSGRKKVAIIMDSKIINLFPSKTFSLNANVWAYLNHPSLKNMEPEAGMDLQAHHINSIVIPGNIVPRMQNPNYKRFLKYLSNFKGVKNILLYTNYKHDYNRNGYKGGQFMSPEWKRNFIKWYSNLVEIIHDNGFPDAQIYLYPYDEVSEKEDIQYFKTLIQWARKAVPNIKFYATLQLENALREILPLVDIAQLGKLGIKLLRKAPPYHAEIWVYPASRPSRTASPYAFYRLMAWQAFANGYKGIGFWEYLAQYKNLVEAPLINPSLDYSVVYNGTNKTIISTRRWEAFRLGIEDYEIINSYGKKFGAARAKKMVDRVLAYPDDLSLADEVRVEMTKHLLDYFKGN